MKPEIEKALTAMLEKDNRAAGIIARAAAIFDSLSENENAFIEIARHCRRAKSTVHRTLKLMEEANLVAEDEAEHRYYVGQLINRLITDLATTHECLIYCAFEDMKYIADITREEVTLDILSGSQIVSLHEIPSSHSIRATSSDKRNLSYCAGASAKVLLSQLNDEKLDNLLKYLRIPRLTENTVIDKTILMTQIKEVREKGYAVSRGEKMAGALCISAPIRNYPFPSVLSIIGLDARLQNRQKTVIRELRRAARRISGNVSESIK